MPASMPDDQIITKYLVSILSDEQRAELAQLLGENSMVSNEDPDDLASYAGFWVTGA